MTRIILLSIVVNAILAGLVFPGVVDFSTANTSAAGESASLESEDVILNATVRFMVESWIVRPDEKGYDIDYTVGHGTVMNGRYLVTHNHFDIPLNILNRQGDVGSYAVVYLYDSRGELRHRGPLSDFQLAREDVETLVFRHREEGFFAGLGFGSVAFSAWTNLALEPGMEVAQVDWDGATARVDMVNVQEVLLDGSAPRMVLDDGVLPGASGGGIFYKGVHVANNWQLQEKIDATGSVIEAVTVVALNSEGIVDLQ